MLNNNNSELECPNCNEINSLQDETNKIYKCKKCGVYYTKKIKEKFSEFIKYIQENDLNKKDTINALNKIFDFSSTNIKQIYTSDILSTSNQLLINLLGHYIKEKKLDFEIITISNLKSMLFVLKNSIIILEDELMSHESRQSINEINKVTTNFFQRIRHKDTKLIIICSTEYKPKNQIIQYYKYFESNEDIYITDSYNKTSGINYHKIK